MSVHRERYERVRELMQQHGIDAFLILTLEDYFYFTGDIRKQPRALIFRNGDPALLVFSGEVDEARKNTFIEDIRGYTNLHEMMVNIMGLLKDRGASEGKLAVQMEFGTPAFLLDRFKMANPGVKVVDSKPITAPLRSRKSPEEVEAIRLAASIAEKGMDAAINAVREGVTELDVAAEAEYAMRKAGAERIAFPVFVNSGKRSGWLHGMATRKKIQKGDLVLIDVGPVHMGYVADMARTVVVGEPTAEQRRMHETYVSAAERLLDTARPGMRLFELEQVVQSEFDRHGYGDRFVRGFTHGIGLAFEEFPFPTIFPEDVMAELKAGMTLVTGHSVLAVPGTGGVRVEDTFLLTENGAELITRYPKELRSV